MNQKMYLSEHLALPSEATLSQTSKLDGVRLSPHFSLAEMTVTNVKNVSNLPGPEEIENLKRLCGWLEHLSHLTGCAADIKVFGIEQAMRYAVILLNYADNTMQEFDELLIERSKKGTYWVHFAVRPKENRRKVMFIQT